MALGEAFVNIRADLRPFSNDLDKGLKPIVEKFEKAINAQLGRRMGKSVSAGLSDEMSKGAKLISEDLQSEIRKGAGLAGERAGRESGRRFKKGFGDEGKDLGFIKKFLAAAISTLEDGFSALPAEVKAIVAGVLAAALVPVGAFVSAAISAAIVAGVAGLGTVLAFQFQQIQDEGADLVDELRTGLLNAARSFGQPVLDAIGLVRSEFSKILPVITSIFSSVSGFVVPLTKVFTDFTTLVLEGLDDALKNANISALLTALSDGFTDLGESIGDAFRIILNNPNIAESLEDLLVVISDLIYFGARFLSFLTDTYVAFKRTVDIAVNLVSLLYDLLFASNELDKSFDSLVNSLRLAFQPQTTGKNIQDITGAALVMGKTFDGTVSATKKQEQAAKDAEKAQKELAKSIQDTIDIQFSSIDSTIAYQRSLDELADALKKTTKDERTLNLGSEDGRKVTEDFSKALQNLARDVQDRVATGKIASQDAQAYYDAEVRKLRDLATAAGISGKKFDELFGAAAQLQSTKFDIKSPALQALIADVGSAIKAINLLKKGLRDIPRHGTGVVGGNLEFSADGGRFTSPTVTAVAEGYSPEVILPESKPLRSAQILAKSGLAGLLGGGATTVFAYFDGEPFQARIVRTAQGVNTASARNLSQRPRLV